MNVVPVILPKKTDDCLWATSVILRGLVVMTRGSTTRFAADIAPIIVVCAMAFRSAVDVVSGVWHRRSAVLSVADWSFVSSRVA